VSYVSHERPQRGWGNRPDRALSQHLGCEIIGIRAARSSPVEELPRQWVGLALVAASPFWCQRLETGSQNRPASSEASAES